MTIESQLQIDVPRLVLDAVERCQDYLSPTPLEYSRYLGDQIDGEADRLRGDRFLCGGLVFVRARRRRRLLVGGYLLRIPGR